MGEIKWFYEQKGKRIGPVEEEEIKQLIDDGVLNYGSLVWKEGFSDWKKIEETELIKYLSRKAPPPLKGEGVNNTIVWILAFAPIIGTILEYTFAYAKYGDTGLGEIAANLAVKQGEFWYITLILNIALSYLDAAMLKRAGHDVSKFGGWAWLVPVYLYKRAKAVGHNLAYFIVWWVSFVVSLM